MLVTHVTLCTEVKVITLNTRPSEARKGLCFASVTFNCVECNTNSSVIEHVDIVSLSVSRSVVGPEIN